MNKKKLFINLFPFIFLILSFFLSLELGTTTLSFSDWIKAFTDKESFSHTIIFALRLPRSILALFSGSLLAAAGAAFQMYFRNSLAEPGILGISAGATLGAVIAQTIGVSAILFGTLSPVNVTAFIGALFAGAIITILAQKHLDNLGTVTLLLCGSSLGTFYSAVSSIILLTRTKELNGIYTWILGSFNGRGWNEVRFILIPSIIAISLLFMCTSKLDLMAGGEKTAQSLGLETTKLRTTILIAAGLAVSSSVCACGTINFVGLIAPHIVRLLYGTKGKTLVSLSIIYGAILMLLSDTVARSVIKPSELPAGLITSMLGAPFFISLIFNNSTKGGRYDS